MTSTIYSNLQQADFHQLQTEVDKMRARVQIIVQNLNTSSTQIELAHISSLSTTDAEKALLQAIAATDAELQTSHAHQVQLDLEIQALVTSLAAMVSEENSTEVVLQNLQEATKDELDMLTKQLANTTRDVHTCKGNLSMQMGPLTFQSKGFVVVPKQLGFLDIEIKIRPY